MSLKSAALFALIFASFGSAEAAVSASTSTQVEWPNYSAAPWTVVERGPFVVRAKLAVENNEYVFGDAHYEIRVGTGTVYTDSEVNPTLRVSEIEIKGFGPIVRVLEMRGMGMLSRQLMVKGKWWNVPEDAELFVNIDNTKSVIQNSEPPKVTLTAKSGDEVLMKVVVEMKKQKKN